MLHDTVWVLVARWEKKENLGQGKSDGTNLTNEDARAHVGCCTRRRTDHLDYLAYPYAHNSSKLPTQPPSSAPSKTGIQG